MMLHNAMTHAGSTSLSPIGPDADLIATCAAFSDLERASDVVTNKFKGDLVKGAPGKRNWRRLSPSKMCWSSA